MGDVSSWVYLALTWLAWITFFQSDSALCTLFCCHYHHVYQLYFEIVSLFQLESIGKATAEKTQPMDGVIRQLPINE